MEKPKDTFNFYLSQCRIRVEMTFGRLVAKWRILKKPLMCCMENNMRIISACTRLHNFCIDQGDTLSMKQHKENKNDLPIQCCIQNGVSTKRVQSITRKLIVEEIQRKTLQRPSHNLHRNLSDQPNHQLCIFSKSSFGFLSRCFQFSTSDGFMIATPSPSNLLV